MNRLLPLPPREIIRRLRRLGLEGPFPSGKHQYMRRGQFKVRVPNPHGEYVSAGLIADLLRRAGLSREQWESAGDQS